MEIFVYFEWPVVSTHRKHESDVMNSFPHTKDCLHQRTQSGKGKTAHRMGENIANHTSNQLVFIYGRTLNKKTITALIKNGQRQIDIFKEDIKMVNKHMKDALQHY